MGTQYPTSMSISTANISTTTVPMHLRLCVHIYTDIIVAYTESDIHKGVMTIASGGSIMKRTEIGLFRGLGHTAGWSPSIFSGFEPNWAHLVALEKLGFTAPPRVYEYGQERRGYTGTWEGFTRSLGSYTGWYIWRVPRQYAKEGTGSYWGKLVAYKVLRINRLHVLIKLPLTLYLPIKSDPFDLFWARYKE